jgi:hypothetical protein
MHKKLNTTFKEQWLKQQYSRLRKVYKKEEVSNDELKDLLISEYDKRRLVNGRLFNNTTNKNEVMTQEQFINNFLNNENILSGYSTFYETHDNSVNIGSSALKLLLDNRKTFKKRMEESEYGSDSYTYYKILQLTYKVLANSYYGILGERNSVFYNPYVQNSITMTGQDLITTSIISLENFLADNVRFNDFDDVMNFIENTLGEAHNDQILKYIDVPKDKKDLINYLVNKTDRQFDVSVLDKIVSSLSIEQINILYYKNKIIEFIENSFFQNKLEELTKYKYLETPEEAMMEKLAAFKDTIVEFCFSDIIFEDRFKRAVKTPRKNIIGADTDSNFINLNNYVIEVSKMLQLDRSNGVQQMTVMNIFIDIITTVLEKIFWKLTGNMGIPEEHRKNIAMKSEFLYRRIMTTRNKKSYSGSIIGELGRLLSKPVLDIKGLSIRKTNVPKKLRKQFTEILTNDVLNAEKIDLKSIITKFDALGHQVEDSLRAGDIEYSLPKSLEQFTNYKDPSTLEPVRGTLIWNALEPEQQIVPPEKVNMLKIKAVDKNSKELLQLKQTHPDKYNTIMRVVFNEGVAEPKIDISRFGLSSIAIPKSVVKIPDYLLPMIDYQSMVNNNMTNGYIILESLGIYTEEVKTTKYKSNIIEL